MSRRIGGSFRGRSVGGVGVGGRVTRKPKEFDGFRFDSTFEYERYLILRDRRERGEIFDLRVHPAWPLVVNGISIGRYTADFRYAVPLGAELVGVVVNGIDGLGVVVEECKSPWSRTRDYVLRRKVFEAVYGQTVSEITKPEWESAAKRSRAKAAARARARRAATQAIAAETDRGRDP